MTINATSNRVSFTPTSASNTFPVALQSYLATDFAAVLTAPASAGGGQTTLVNGTDFVMTPVGSLTPPEWQCVTTNQVLPGYTLQVYTSVALEQDSAYTTGQQFGATSLQADFDRSVQMAQRMQDQVNRALVAPDGDVNPNLALPPAAQRANMTPSFDGNGNLTLIDVVGGTTSLPVVLVADAPAILVPASSSGIASSFATANGQCALLQGNANIATQATWSITTNGCTATVNTALNTPVAGQPVGYYAITAMAGISATATISATFQGSTYQTTVYIEAVEQGATGPQGPTGSTGPSGAGTTAVSMYLTNPSQAVFAYANGSVASFAGVSGQAIVLQGTTNVSESCAFAATAAGLTGTVNYADNTPIAGQPIGYYQVTAMSGTTGTLTITAQYEGLTLTQVFTVTQAQAGYQIVASLPTTNLFVGRVVFNTTDNQLYRYTGSAWTAEIPAANLIGTLTASQISSISAAQLTGSITTTQIGNAQITTPLLAAAAVESANIAAGTIVAGNIAAGTITGSNIAAGTITAANILSNTLTSNTIQAGAITAALISVSSLSSISANIGTVTAGVLQNSGGSAVVNLNQSYIEFNTGTYMMVRGIGFGSSSQFLEWFGPVQSSAGNFVGCTEANGLYYVKVNGSVQGGSSKIGATTVYNASGTVTIPAGVSQMIVELWGDTGLGGHGSTSNGTQGSGGGSGSYARSVYNVSTQAGNTLTMTLGAGNSGTTSGIAAGTMTGFTTMTVYGGLPGVVGAAADGRPGGKGGAVGMGGNVINAPGNDGSPGGALNGSGNGTGGAPVVGLYAVGNPGGLGNLNNTTNSAGLPAVAAFTFI